MALNHITSDQSRYSTRYSLSAKKTSRKIIPTPHELNILTNRDANDEREVHLH